MPNLYQLSTLSALLLGDFEPSLSIGELKRHGTLGIGTFEGLGGELIMLDGVVWNGTHSGEAVPAADIEKRPLPASLTGSLPPLPSNCPLSAVWIIFERFWTKLQKAQKIVCLLCGCKFFTPM